jgi:hypothetical protein
MATTILSDGNVDAGLQHRWLVRRADVLRTLGYDVAAFRALRKVFEHAEDMDKVHALTYPAFRTGCLLAAKQAINNRDFEEFVKRARVGIDSGHLPPHEVAHVLEGVADAHAARFRETKNSGYRKKALEYSEMARSQSEKATKFGGGQHLEFSLRLEILPISFAEAGILEVLSVPGMPAQGRAQQIAAEIQELAIKSQSHRVAQRMAEKLSTLRT